MAGKIILIAGADYGGGIGKNNSIPWHYPEDLRHFRRTTMGHNIVMGRKTWESFGGGALKGRANIVLSESLPVGYRDGVYFERSFQDVLGFAKEGYEDYYIIGGQQIYEQFLPHADEIILTLIPELHECDRHFPLIDRDQFDLVDHYQSHINKGELNIIIKYYERK